MYQWIVYLHVLGSLTLFLAHGASAAVTFRLRHEKEPARIRALLEASGYTLPVFFISLLVLLVAGIVAGFMGKWWRFGWMWTSLGLLVVLFGWMSWFAARQFTPLKKAAGVDYFEGGKTQPAVVPLPDEEIAALTAAINPLWPTIIGYGIPVVILWLMMFKPF